MCKKGCTCTDQSTEDYHLTLQLYIAFYLLLAHCFGKGHIYFNIWFSLSVTLEFRN